MRSIIINADDYGLSSGVCASIIELLQRDAISNTTIMICVENAYEHCRKLCEENLAHRAGVHLQTTPEEYHRHPLSPPEEIPTLVDSSGQFKPQDHTDWINPEEIEIEWERQIVKVMEALERKPSHLDSHHGVHRKTELTPIYLKLAKKYKIPVRGGRALNQIDGKPYGVASSAIAFSDWTGQNKDINELKQIILESLEQVEEGIPELVVHPGFCDEELIASSTWNSVRENDHNVLLALSEEKWLEQNNITLSCYPKIT